MGDAVTIFVGGAGALVFSLEAVAFIRRLALRHRILDKPNERSSHIVPTPRGGGVAIVIATLLGLVFAQWWYSPWPPRQAWGASCALILVAAVSLWDDIRPLQSGARLAVHFLAALVVLVTVGHWRELQVPGAGVLPLAWAGTVVTVLWLVWLANSYNFMDGIDGLAGSQGVVAGIGWAVLGYQHGDPIVAFVGATLAGSCAGFLAYNWAPATIFMGDVGSAFVGLLLAMLGIALTSRDPLGPAYSVLLVWPFVFDTTFTLARRVRRGERLLSAHRTHLYQRFVAAGHTHQGVTLLYVLLAVVGLLAALALEADLMRLEDVSCVIGLLSLLLWCLVVWRERVARMTTAGASHPGGSCG